MEQVVYKSDNKPKKILVVLLSGFGADANYFEKNDWILAARAITQQVDFVAPHAHFGYYANQTFIERLREDVLKPAKARGYREIWFVGVSMGGMGSILYSQKYPGEVKRIYFIAPYFGDGEVQDEIRASGGLDKWQLRKENSDKWQYQIWERLKQISEDPEHRVNIFIGYGDKDKLDGHDLLAKYLPDNHVIKIEGGHKDVVFSMLWRIMLERGLLNPGLDRTVFNH